MGTNTGLSRSAGFAALSALLVVSWSSGFIGIRYATESATVFQTLFWRSLLSGLGLLPFLAFGPRPTVRAIGQQALYALLGMGLYLGGFALAIGQRVPTGLVALMADLVPLAIAALSGPMLGERLSPRQWLGTAIALAGVLLVSTDALRLGAAPGWAYLLPIAGMLSFAVATVMQEARRDCDERLTIPQRLCLQCLWAAAFFAPFAHATGGIIADLTTPFVVGVGWLVLLATYCSWLTYYLMLRLYPPARVAAVIYLSPPVTMIWAAVWFHEPLTYAMGLGLFVTFAGVWLVSGGWRAEPRPT